ncbi:MAG: tryptophan-rich sensory protein [Patescibacteria group bacterium]
MNTKLLKTLTLGAYMVMIVVNYLAISLPIAGRQTGDISDSYPNLFAPAGYAFSIWGLIYLLLGIYAVYQLWLGKNEIAARINRLFIINALLNAAWIFAWHYDYIGFSVIIMAGLLLTLIRIADILRIGPLTKKEGWLLRLPFSVYFGWITVATIANITVFLVSIGWSRFGLSEIFWTIAILLVGALIGAWRTLKDRAAAYGLVLIWAYGAILYKHLAESGFSGKYPVIIWTVALCLLIFGGTIALAIIKKKNK